ncbi:MAG: AraC family transcriptional regulator [Rhodocyclaceae bacterium]|jgi:AraC-like DNA-binding protein|nr:AraC family transcriptional regulator [Rhodocyclaceae bacterium]
MTSLALLFTGFSVVSALLLALTHFRTANYSSERGAKASGLLLLAALAGLQAVHWAWLYLDLPWTNTGGYQLLLFVVAPVFWVYSQCILRPDAAPWRVQSLAHAVPAMIAPWLEPDIALSVAFSVGAGYLLALGRDVYRLRAEREQFVREIALLGVIVVIAVGVTVLGVVRAELPGKTFFELYAIAIGLAFFLIQGVLALRPQLAGEVTEAAKASYANSTLTHIDCPALLDRLDGLMSTEHLFEDGELSLAALAARLGVSSHQLSELMNVHLGKSFARFLREQRVAAARRMLVAEPSASVLSVGLSVGFSAQSNFYEAFREIEGMTPGQFRKLTLMASMSRPKPDQSP